MSNITAVEVHTPYVSRLNDFRLSGRYGDAIVVLQEMGIPFQSLVIEAYSYPDAEEIQSYRAGSEVKYPELFHPYLKSSSVRQVISEGSRGTISENFLKTIIVESLTSDIILLGGYLNACLANAIVSIVQYLQKNQDFQVNLHFVQPWIARGETESAFADKKFRDPNHFNFRLMYPAGWRTIVNGEVLIAPEKADKSIGHSYYWSKAEGLKDYLGNGFVDHF